jgi:CRISPR/Cas system endoribonuclease Cas6 (RAMP superfamily)
MPTTYTLELRTNPLTTHGSHHTTLGTLLHGFLHHQLSTSEQTLPLADRIATKTHNKQREPVSIRILNVSRQRITCQITLLDDTWANVYDQAFNQGQPFGNGKPLSGTIHNTQRFTWTLEQLRNRVQELGAPQHLDIEFCSLTSMMHKKTAWDVPYPELVFRSLTARWADFGGPDLHAHPDELVEHAIERVSYRTEHARIPTESGSLPGFKGQLRLALRGDEQSRKDLVILTTFGTFVNVGKRVAYGCGMIQAEARLSKAVLVDLNALIE